MDTDENVYYFVCDEEMLSAGLVALTADLEQNLMCIGDVTHNEDGSMTIVDPSGITATMAVVESTEDYLQVVIDGALEVTLVPQDAAVVLEKMSIVEEESQNIN